MKTTELNTPATNSLRRYDLDWLRVICIVILLYYHVGMIYVPWDWHIKSTEKSEVMRWVMIWLHYWRMPLLFFISGAGTYFALRSRSLGGYAKERVKRLFVPLVVGMFLIVPPQIYYEQLFNGQHFTSYFDFYRSVFDFVPYPKGSFSWHHLWFVAYLFLYSLLSIPLFYWLKTPQGERFGQKVENWATLKGGVLGYAFVLILSQVALKPYFPEETHALVDDWAYFTFNLLLFWGGYLLVSRRALWEEMTRQRRIYGWATLLSTIVLYSLYSLLRFVYPEWDEMVWYDVVWDTNAFCLTWFSVVTTIAYGYQYLNRPQPILRQLNEAVYPFYILHQTVIVVIGFYILKWNIGVWPGFILVSTLSLLISIVLYWLVIKRIKILRVFFGLK